jgi:MerR family Zn(II)-responsive transcriptional regulator of zntA
VKYYRIGEVAKIINTTTATLRHYEKIKLITPSIRAESNYRLYSENDIKVLKFIVNAKKAGFTLREIQELLTLEPDTVMGSVVIKSMVTYKMHQLKSLINNLNDVYCYLNEISQLCEAKSNPKDCLLLKSLNRWS